MRTLGSPILALLLQAPSGVVSDSSGSSILGLISRSTPVSKAVLLTLAFMSIGSWSIILYKLWVFRRSARQSSSFLDVFRRSSKFSEVQAVCRSLTESPLVGLFQSGYAELTAQLRHTAPPDDIAANPKGGSVRPTLKSLAAVDRALMRASVVEVNKLESRITFLATTASIAPFEAEYKTPEEILRDADIAMHHAKDTGHGVSGQSAGQLAPDCCIAMSELCNAMSDCEQF